MIKENENTWEAKGEEFLKEYEKKIGKHRSLFNVEDWNTYYGEGMTLDEKIKLNDHEFFHKLYRPIDKKPMVIPWDD